MERVRRVGAWGGLVTVIGALAAATGARAQLAPGAVSAPITAVAYRVTVDSAATTSRQLGVAMTFTVRGTEPVLLALPAWSPGHYQLLWFARRVSRFAATEAGLPLEWGMADQQTWRVVPNGPGRVTVSFRYLADTIDRAEAWTQPDFSFFLGTNLFLYPVGRGFDWPATVTVRTEPGWRITTGMTPGAAPGTFGASNYHDLVDRPFFVGRFDLDSARIADHWFRLAWYPPGSLTAARSARTFGWIRAIVPAEAAVFDTIPFGDYTIFMVSDTVVNGGGLEHQDAQMDEVTTGQLDSPGLAGLYAHELFHAWNVKRLRPADLWPYRYDDIQPTRWLWVSEGITSYYGGLAQLRGGVTDSAQFLASVAASARAIMDAPPTAPGDASLLTWIGPMDGSGLAYYAQGTVIGFLLDVMVRHASANRRSLDDVMRTLYRTTYERGRGFTPADWWGTVAREAGTPQAPFLAFARRYVDGREPFPYDSVLPLAGLRMVVDTIWEPLLGVGTMADSGGPVVTFVAPGEAAAEAGIRVGDRLLSVGGVEITDNASFAAFRQRYRGTSLATVPAVLRRDGATVTVQVPVRLFGRLDVRVEPTPGAPEEAVRVRHGLFTGTVSH